MGLTKLSIDNPTKWYKFVDLVMRMINTTFQRSINTTPIELLIGIKMRNNDYQDIKRLINDEMQKIFEEERVEIRREAKKQSVKM